MFRTMLYDIPLPLSPPFLATGIICASSEVVTSIMASLPEDHIRLIHIPDATTGDAIRLTRTNTFPLPASGDQKYDDNEKPLYIALSYFWGKDRKIIDCDNQKVEVSANLVHAFKRLRQHFPNRLLWTDNLSINQHDDNEKSHQVGIMGRIFASAETVVVWLGDDVADVYEELERLTSLDGMREEHSSGSDPEEKRSKERVALIRRLASNRWFTRAWTFQEIRLARSAVVMLGSNLMPWEEFITKIQILRKLEPRISTGIIRSQPQSYSRFIEDHEDKFFSSLDELNSGTSDDLASLLFLTWYREATEKRDKVYSLLSSELFHRQDHGIEIDYTIPWQSLCIKAARASMNTGKNLKVLRIAGMTQRRKSVSTGLWDPNELSQLLNHPSWAPDWWYPPQQTRSHSSFISDERGCFNELNFCCPRNEPPIQDVNNTSPFLILQGVLLGIINIGDPPTFFPGGLTLLHPPFHCAGYGQELLKDPAQPDRVIPKVHMPIFLGSIQHHLDGDCPCVPFHERKSRQFGFQHSNHTNNHRNIRDPRSGLSGLKFSNDHFPITGIPRPGDKSAAEWPAQVLAPSVEPGDWLVLLSGGGLPFILRPLKDTMGRIVKTQGLSGFAKEGTLPADAGCFVLVGEASMCWDQLWPRKWDQYCRAGTFVIV